MEVSDLYNERRKNVEPEYKAQVDHPMPDHAAEDTDMKVQCSEDVEMKYWDSKYDDINKPLCGDAWEERELEDDELEGNETEEAETEEGSKADVGDDLLKHDRKTARIYLRFLDDARFRYLEGMDKSDH